MRRIVMIGALVGLAGCVAPEAQRVVVLQAPPVLAQPGCDTSFRVVNTSNRTVEQLYFSSSNINAWGPDQLGQGVLPPGRAANFATAVPGFHDFRVVWAGGRVSEIRGINVCQASQITVTNQGLSAS